MTVWLCLSTRDFLLSLQMSTQNFEVLFNMYSLLNVFNRSLEPSGAVQNSIQVTSGTLPGISYYFLFHFQVFQTAIWLPCYQPITGSPRTLEGWQRLRQFVQHCIRLRLRHNKPKVPDHSAEQTGGLLWPWIDYPCWNRTQYLTDKKSLSHH